MIGGYRIVGEIGRGGMGAVLRAEHRTLARQVALKVHTAGNLATEKQRQRFRLETEALARLRHPGIVAIHDAGEHAGSPYLVMDLIEGESLEGKIARDGALPARVAARLLRDLAQALHYAHGQLILHRDIKPANVLLTRGPEGQVQALITDFGLAKLLDPEQAGPTRSGQMLGTPAFMPPEQAAGKEADYRADVYGLGATLYACLTEVPPHEGETLFELLASFDRDPAPPVAVRSGVPAELSAICMKCLERTPAQRYADADALAKDLERYLNGEPVEARALGSFQRGRRWLKRHPGLSVSVSLAVLLVVALIAVAYEVRQGRASDVKQRISERNYLNNRGIVHTKGREWSQAIAFYTRAIGLDPDYAAPYQNRGYALWALGNVEQARQDFERAIEVEARMVRRQKRVRESAEACLRAIQAGCTTPPRLGGTPRKVDTWQSLLSRALSEFDQGQFMAALACCNASIELEVTVDNLSTRAIVHHALGNDEAALADAQRGVEEFPIDGTAQATLATVLSKLDRIDDAVVHAQHAVKLGGLSNAAYEQVGIVLYFADPEAARAAFEAVLAEDPLQLNARFCLGGLLHNQGRSDKAVKHFLVVAETARRDDPLRQKALDILAKLGE